MIEYRTPINFLLHVYMESIPDTARIINAQAEDDYGTIETYLIRLKSKIGEWLLELDSEKESKEK